MHCANKKNKANEQELLIGNYADGQSNDKIANFEPFDKYRTWILACLDQGHRTVNNQKGHSAVHTPSLIFMQFRAKIMAKQVVQRFYLSEPSTVDLRELA